MVWQLRDKKSGRWLRQAGGRRAYTVTIVWKLVWADLALVVLGEWLSYRGGRISRFDRN